MVEWQTSAEPVNYPEAVRVMERRVAAILAGEAGELVWLLEHPPLYTAGTSAGRFLPDTRAIRLPVHKTGRGGSMTYHGPGQRIAYVMLDLSGRNRDVRRFIWNLEEWIIRTLSEFGVSGERRPGRIGVWVVRKEKPPMSDGTSCEEKIAAIGVRLRRWVSFHGISINVEPDLSHYADIVPCGIEDRGVTSLVDLGLPVTLADLDTALIRTFDRIFPECSKAR
ncbi:MAG: lipoyl(octanoyl) transferase LipB [Paracoccaceae bacterium]|nr:lipoyl(octanoyl) transferase LipB [Paracoccaceae bacterium]MDE2911458.1 lipoyl(octanoyl) transferase LipB [Paracoccaceae bacterium]